MEIDFSGLDDISKEELEESAFFVDFLPKTLKTGAMFIMSGLTMMHVKNGYCMLVKFTDEENIELPQA